MLIHWTLKKLSRSLHRNEAKKKLRVKQCKTGDWITFFIKIMDSNFANIKRFCYADVKRLQKSSNSKKRQKQNWGCLDRLVIIRSFISFDWFNTQEQSQKNSEIICVPKIHRNIFLNQIDFFFFEATKLANDEPITQNTKRSGCNFLIRTSSVRFWGRSGKAKDEITNNGNRFVNKGS